MNKFTEKKRQDLRKKANEVHDTLVKAMLDIYPNYNSENAESIESVDDFVAAGNNKDDWDNFLEIDYFIKVSDFYVKFFSKGEDLYPDNVDWDKAIEEDMDIFNDAHEAAIRHGYKNTNDISSIKDRMNKILSNWSFTKLLEMKKYYEDELDKNLSPESYNEFLKKSIEAINEELERRECKNDYKGRGVKI